MKGEGTLNESGSRGAAPAPGNEYRVEIVDSFGSWESLSVSWNALLWSSRANTVFLTWEWLFSWAESFLRGDRRLFILAVYRNHELVGIAPWYLNSIAAHVVCVNQIEFLGSPEAGSDYLDVIIKRGREREVAHVLYQYLFEQARPLWDCMLLADIPADSLFLLHFLSRIESDGKYTELSKGSYCPLVSLPKAGDWVPGASQKRKARFKQDLSRLEKSGELDHQTVFGEAVSARLDDFFSFYNGKTGHDGRTLHTFLRKVDFRGRDQELLQLDFLTLDGRTIAALLHLRYQQELLLYLMAVDREISPRVSSGNLLVGLCLQEACGEGMVRYDFLKGNEHYKFYWADGGRASLTVRFSQKKLSSILFTTARFVKYTAKMLLR